MCRISRVNVYFNSKTSMTAVSVTFKGSLITAEHFRWLRQHIPSKLLVKRQTIQTTEFSSDKSKMNSALRNFIIDD